MLLDVSCIFYLGGVDDRICLKFRKCLFKFIESVMYLKFNSHRLLRNVVKFIPSKAKSCQAFNTHILLLSHVIKGLTLIRTTKCN